MLDKHEVTTTYTAAAVSLERAPEIADYLRGSRHETCSHGYRWIHSQAMDVETTSLSALTGLPSS